MPMATWPEPHRMLLTSSLGRLKTDPRVLAVRVGGSLARGAATCRPTCRSGWARSFPGSIETR
jgi:hypothetical protein